MTIKELNKLIKEELDAFLENEDELDAELDAGVEDGGDLGDDDIEVTTDEPDVEDDPLATLKQIYDMLKPIVEPEGEVEDFGGEEDLEGEEEVEDEEGDGDEEDEGDEADEDMKEEMKDEKDEDMKEEVTPETTQLQERFQKLANIIK